MDLKLVIFSLLLSYALSSPITSEESKNTKLENEITEKSQDSKPKPERTEQFVNADVETPETPEDSTNREISDGGNCEIEIRANEHCSEDLILDFTRCEQCQECVTRFESGSPELGWEFLVSHHDLDCGDESQWITLANGRAGSKAFQRITCTDNYPRHKPIFIPDQSAIIVLSQSGIKEFGVKVYCKKLEKFFPLHFDQISLIASEDYPTSLPEISGQYYFEQGEHIETVLKPLDFNLGSELNCLVYGNPNEVKLCGDMSGQFIPAITVTGEFRLEIKNRTSGNGFLLALIPYGNSWNLKDLEFDYYAAFYSILGRNATGKPNILNLNSIVASNYGSEDWNLLKTQTPSEILANYSRRCYELLDPMQVEFAASTIGECMENISRFLDAIYRPMKIDEQQLSTNADFLEMLFDSIRSEEDFRSPFKRIMVPENCPEHNGSHGMVVYSGLGKDRLYHGHCEDRITVPEEKVVALFWIYLELFGATEDSKNLLCFERNEFIIVREYWKGKIVNVSCYDRPGNFFKGITNEVEIAYFTKFYSKTNGYIVEYEAVDFDTNDEVMSEMFDKHMKNADISSILGGEPELSIREVDKNTTAGDFPFQLLDTYNFEIIVESLNEADAKHVLHQIARGFGRSLEEIVLFNEDYTDTLSAIFMLKKENVSSEKLFIEAAEGILNNVYAAWREENLTSFQMQDFDECRVKTCEENEQCYNMDGGYYCFDREQGQQNVLEETPAVGLFIAGAICILIVLIIIGGCIFHKCCRKRSTSYRLRRVTRRR